jgi:hypothetical protein
MICRLSISLLPTTGYIIMKGIFFAGVAVLLATTASAAPLFPSESEAVKPSIAENVKIVCEENGQCYQTGRRVVARWVYGENVFYGPYVGPGYYGRPNSHYGWSFFGPW